MPLDGIAEPLQRVARSLGAVERDDLVVLAVRHEDRDCAVRARGLSLHFRGQRQIRGERQNAGERLGMAQCRLQHDGAALREAGQHDLLTFLGANQGFDDFLRGADSRFVLGAAAELEDVVPGAHAHARY